MRWSKPLNYVLAALAVLILCEIFFVHPHVYSPWHAVHGFDAMLGFGVSIVMVLVAKPLLDKLIKRHEDYYDTHDTGSDTSKGGNDHE